MLTTSSTPNVRRGPILALPTCRPLIYPLTLRPAFPHGIGFAKIVFCYPTQCPYKGIPETGR